MNKVAQSFFSAVFFVFPICSPATAQRIVDTKNVVLKISKNEKIEIQNMYSRNKCVGDKIPPKPILFGKVKLGSISYRTGTTIPPKCPGTSVNAILAEYTASNVAGVEKFKIHWKTTNGFVYVRNYTIKID